MNPTLGYLWSRVRAAWCTNPLAVRRLVRADLKSEPPTPGHLPHGLETLLKRAKGSHNMPYFLPNTVTASVLAVLTAAAAAFLATRPERGAWSLPAAGLLAVLCAVCLFQAVGRRHGPALIDSERYRQAHMTLRDSGDAHSRPMPVLLAAAMAALFLIDGAFAGYTLTATAFASLFTPRVAMFASFAWSCAIAWLLFHLTSAAAMEGVINRRRNAIRELLGSDRPADRERADAMIDLVGPALGNDYSRRANRCRARVALWLVVIGLSAATLVVRVSSEYLDMTAVDEVGAATVDDGN